MKRAILTVLILFITNVCFAQISHGVVKEGLTLKSKILGKEVRYTIYLPFDYETSNRYYPVVYLLHGYTDNDMGWIQFGEANLIADKAIAEREIPSMIIAMPDGGLSWYVNNFDGSVRYEDFFIEEFIPHVESEFRIRAEKRYRGIAGLSMGGYGTLVQLLHHPDLFSAGAALSAAIYTNEEFLEMSEERWAGWPSWVFGKELVGEARLTEHLLENSPIALVKKADPKVLRQVRIYLDCGDDDYLTVGNAMFHIALKEKGIRHEYRVRDGAHRWSYWRSGLVDALKFIGVSFHQP